MTFDPQAFIYWPIYATITEGNVADAQKFIGNPWKYTANGLPMPRLGDEVALGLEGGVDLICRVDEIGDGVASGVIVAARATPPPADFSDEELY